MRVVLRHPGDCVIILHPLESRSWLINLGCVFCGCWGRFLAWRFVKSQLDALFTDQETSLSVISYDEMDGVSGMRPTIFDLQHLSFISKGVAIDTKVFERLVREALDSVNGFSQLQNEFSKMMYSYRRLWELLSAGARKYTYKRLAYLVSIDLSLIPLLLQIAENDGIDVTSRVAAPSADDNLLSY